MEAPNLGPEWFWNTLFALAGLGAVIGIVGVVYGIYWLITHVTISIS